MGLRARGFRHAASHERGFEGESLCHGSNSPEARESAGSKVYLRGNVGMIPNMRSPVGTLVLAAGLSAQTVSAPPDPARTVVGRLELDRYKAHIKGLAQFGDRMQ